MTTQITGSVQPYEVSKVQWEQLNSILKITQFVKLLGRMFCFYALLVLATAFFLQETENRVFGIT
jgi:hypothetical protein